MDEDSPLLAKGFPALKGLGSLGRQTYNMQHLTLGGANVSRGSGNLAEGEIEERHLVVENKHRRHFTLLVLHC